MRQVWTLLVACRSDPQVTPKCEGSDLQPVGIVPAISSLHKPLTWVSRQRPGDAAHATADRGRLPVDADVACGGPQLPTAEIVFDTFHVLQHAAAALDEVRRQEFFRAGAVMRAYGRGKRWLLLRRWKTVGGSKRCERA